MEKFKKIMVKLAVALAIFTPLFMAVSALGVKFGLWKWEFGFGTLVRGYGPKLLMATFAVALIALVLSLLVKPRKGWLASLLALCVPLIGMWMGNGVKTKFEAVPIIADITTDTVDVPAFTQAILTQRLDKSHSLNFATNSLDYAAIKDLRSKKPASEAQKTAFPDIKTIALSVDANAAYTKALAAVTSMGMAITTEDKAGGILEATQSSFWFGFKDDVIIRIRADGSGSLIDIRSASRHGKSDIGMNAKRVRALSAKIKG